MNAVPLVVILVLAIGTVLAALIRPGSATPRARASASKGGAG
jgi:hypothetical protein